jgi:hypothetical protein
MLALELRVFREMLVRQELVFRDLKVRLARRVLIRLWPDLRVAREMPG